MTEFSFQMIVKASPEKIWNMYEDLKNRYIWEDDLEEISRNGEFAAGVSGTMKLAGQPEMEYTLTSVVPYQEFWDRTEIPDTGLAICVGHTLIKGTDHTLVKHTMRLEKNTGPILEEDVHFLAQIFTDTPKAILTIKKAVE